MMMPRLRDIVSIGEGFSYVFPKYLVEFTWYIVAFHVSLTSSFACIVPNNRVQTTIDYFLPSAIQNHLSSFSVLSSHHAVKFSGNCFCPPFLAGSLSDPWSPRFVESFISPVSSLSLILYVSIEPISIWISTNSHLISKRLSYSCSFIVQINYAIVDGHIGCLLCGACLFFK